LEGGNELEIPESVSLSERVGGWLEKSPAQVEWLEVCINKKGKAMEGYKLESF